MAAANAIARKSWRGKSGFWAGAPMRLANRLLAKSHSNQTMTGEPPKRHAGASMRVQPGNGSGAIRRHVPMDAGSPLARPSTVGTRQSVHRKFQNISRFRWSLRALRPMPPQPRARALKDTTEWP